MCTMHKPVDVVNFWRAHFVVAFTGLAFYYNGFTVKYLSRPLLLVCRVCEQERG